MPPIGKPLPITDEEADELADVTDEDIDNAEELWEESADDEIKTLLLLVGFVWLTDSHSYMEVETGDIVSRTTVANGLEAMMDTSAVNMNTLTQSLIDGNISLASWESSMLTEIKKRPHSKRGSCQWRMGEHDAKRLGRDGSINP